MSTQSTGERLKHARMTKNYTLKEVGRRLSLDPSAISKYEHGKRLPSVDILQQLAALYNVELEALLGENGRVMKDARTYHIPWPYVRGLSPSVKVLFGLYWLVMLSYVIVDVRVAFLRGYQLLAIPLLGLVLLIKVIVDDRLKRPSAEKTFTVGADEVLVFEHPASEMAIQNIRRRDFFGYVLTLFLTFLMTGFALTALDDQGVMITAVTLFIVNFVIFVSLIMMVALKMTMQKTLLYDQTNRLTNRLKYQLHFLVSTTTCAFHFLIFPDVRHSLNNALATVLVYVLLLLYGLITMQHAFEKHRFFKQYKICKRG